MRYISTRGGAPAVDFEGATLAGLAPDGGLYLPEVWPRFSAGEIAAMAGLDYAALASRILGPYVGDCVAEDDLGALLEDAFRGFEDDAVVPLRELQGNEWLLELHHGPTLAFKDLALQVLGRLFDYFLARRGQRLTIVGATSGDTGSAAIEACRGRAALEIFMLHPKGRVSDIQRRQMTTVKAQNVHNIAIDGTFDDCQAIVKALFADARFRGEVNLSAVNSINWARIAAQIVYYFYAALALGGPGRKVAFSVPTGNFGDIFAGYAASRMGLPVGQLIIATNTNDILDRVLRTGHYRPAAVRPTMSPSMDIQVSSNFERLLHELHDRDGGAVSGLMGDLADNGEFRLAPAVAARARALFASRKVSEAETTAAMADFHRRHGVAIDPHTAVGVVAGRALRADPAMAMVFLATAHAAKFPDAVKGACGAGPAVPSRLAAVLQGEERYNELADDVDAVREFIRARVPEMA